nr:hypothetical protein CFP56_74908 [Quercus suber]
MARRTPQSRFDIAYLLLDHASIEHKNENQGECIDQWCVEHRLRRGDWYRRSWNSEEGNGCAGNRRGRSRYWRRRQCKRKAVRVENRSAGFAAKWSGITHLLASTFVHGHTTQKQKLRQILLQATSLF